MKLFHHPLLCEQYSYVFIWVFVGLWTVFSEAEILPSMYIPYDPSVDYAISIALLLTAVGGTYVSLRLMAFKGIRRQITDADEEAAVSAYKRWCRVRLAVMAVAVCSNVVLFYGIAYSSSAQYCLLVAFIGMLFCWPTMSEFENTNFKG